MQSIKQKYGGKTHQAINRAIRAEMVGGEDLLDAMEKVNRLERRLIEHKLPGAKESGDAMRALLIVRGLMVDILTERYKNV